MSADAVIAAAGRGERFGGEVPKQLLPLGDRPLLAWAVGRFRRHAAVGRVIVVVPPAIAAGPPSWLSEAADRVIEGGATRGESVALGVAAARDAADVLLVHDGARPFASEELVERVLRAAAAGPVVPTLPLTDTIKEGDGSGRVLRTVDRARLRRAQTPQGFPASVFRELCVEPQGGAARREATDDVWLCERRGMEVREVEGDPRNLKITTPDDLEYARWLVESGRVSPP